MAEVIPFPTSQRAVARPPWMVRLIALFVAGTGGLAAAGVLAVRLASGVAARGAFAALAAPIGALLLLTWIAWYAARCRFEVGPSGVRFFGFLPSRLIPLSDLEEIAVVSVAPSPGQRVDRGY